MREVRIAKYKYYSKNPNLTSLIIELDAYTELALAQLEDIPNAHGPSIVVHQSGVTTASTVPVPRSPHDLSRAQSSDESLSTAPESLELEDSAHSLPFGGVIPSSVTYTLHITCDGSTVPVERRNLTVPYNDVHSYQTIEEIAQDCVNKTCAETLMGKSLNFKYGNCTITGQDVDKIGVPLTTREDWNDVCTILTNYWASNVDQTLHVDIYRDYFSIRSRAASDVSFAATKRSEIQALMKRASDGRRYIPRTVLMRFTSPDNIREIIVQDPRLYMEPKEKEDFILSVQKKASCLLAMCVLAGLKMSCLKTLLDNGRSDATLPLDDGHCCHPRCAPDFDNLVEKQGGFRTANFDTVGQHQEFDPNVVIPIHYQPVDSNEDTFAKEGRKRDLENKTSGAYRDTYSPKARACCGSVSVSPKYASVLFNGRKPQAISGDLHVSIDEAQFLIWNLIQ